MGADVAAEFWGSPSRAVRRIICGVEMPVACLEDVVQRNLRTATDPARLKSKRSKGETDLIRLAECHPVVFDLVPAGVLPGLDEIRQPLPGTRPRPPYPISGVPGPG